MCGRFTLRNLDRIRQALGPYLDLDDFVPRYNIAPTQPVITIVSTEEAREMVWGLIPSWSKEPKPIINARAETLDDKASFSESFERRRCLIPADGFYEWRKVGRARQAFHIRMKDGRTFAFAGIWDRWRNNETTIKSCAIITTTANEVLEPIHQRMPVILEEDKYRLWLNEDVSTAELKKSLEPFPSDQMQSYPVSSQVNHADVDNEDLVKRVDVEIGTTPSLF